MSLRKTPIKRELIRRLQAARTAPDARNRMTVGLLRRCACEYLRYWDGEVERDPSLSNRPHCYLWLLDGVPEEDAFFTVLVFWPRPRGMEFFCGTGDTDSLRALDDFGAPKEPVGLFEKMRQQYTMRQGRLRVNRAAAEEWLGRGW